jgi:hypothetical protein
VPEVVPMSGRSQSQPGRSIPNAMNLQQFVNPGYDVSGGIPMPYRTARMLVAGQQPGMPMPFSPPYGTMHQPMENTIPKEYVGYYVGQSPQLGPQQYAVEGAMPPPPLTLRNPPQRTRRVTPDLVPPSERHASRSPSPLSHPSTFLPTEEIQPAQASSIVASPTDYAPPLLPLTAMPDLNISGPVIVNGSYRSVSRPLVPANSIPENGSPHHVPHLANGYGHNIPEEGNPVAHRSEPARKHSTPERNMNAHAPRDRNRRTSSPTSPTSMKRNGAGHPATSANGHGHHHSGPRLSLSPPIGTNGMVNGEQDAHAHNGTPNTTHMNAASGAAMPAIPAPLLSPVAEMLTPSPTRTRAFDLYAAGASAAADGTNTAHESPVRKGTRTHLDRHFGDATSSSAELSKVMGDDLKPASVVQPDTMTMANGTSNGPADAHPKATTPAVAQPLVNGAKPMNPPAVRKNDVKRMEIPPFKGATKSVSAVASANAPTPIPRAGSLSHTALSSARAVATPMIPFERSSGTAASSGRRSGSIANIDLHSTARVNAKQSQGGSASPNTTTSATPVVNGKINNSVLPNGSVSLSPPATSPAHTAAPHVSGTAPEQHQSPASANVPTLAQNQNMWQQATRKGHRKTKSSLAASPVSHPDAPNGSNGGARFQSHGRLSATAVPVSGERKGG